VEQPIVALMEKVGRTNRTKFRDQVLGALLEQELLEMTIPEKPRSSKQRYRLSDKGKQVLQRLKGKES
jgi:ATP-dependent DNA helicase RecG